MSEPSPSQSPAPATEPTEQTTSTTTTATTTNEETTATADTPPEDTNDGDDGDNDDGGVRAWLEPLSKDRIIEVFCAVTKQNQDAKQQVIENLAEDSESYKLFIRSIGYDVTEETLQSLFSAHGEITELALIKDDEGRSRGYAFLTFRNPSDALNAKKNISEIEGREVHVHWAAERNQSKTGGLDSMNDLGQALPSAHSSQPTTSQPTNTEYSTTEIRPGTGDEHSRRGSINGVEMLDPVTECKLFVRNMPFDTSDDELRQVFAPYGKVVDASMVMDRKTGKSKGYGFIVFSRKEEAQAALADPVKNINGRPAYCNLAVDRTDHRQMVHGIYQPYTGPHGPPQQQQQQQQQQHQPQQYSTSQYQTSQYQTSAPAYGAPAQAPQSNFNYGYSTMPYLTSPPMYTSNPPMTFSPPGPQPQAMPPSPQSTYPIYPQQTDQSQNDGSLPGPMHDYSQQQGDSGGRSMRDSTQQLQQPFPTYATYNQ